MDFDKRPGKNTDRIVEHDRVIARHEETLNDIEGRLIQIESDIADFLAKQSGDRGDSRKAAIGPRAADDSETKFPA